MHSATGSQGCDDDVQGPGHFQQQAELSDKPVEIEIGEVVHTALCRAIRGNYQIYEVQQAPGFIRNCVQLIALTRSRGSGLSGHLFTSKHISSAIAAQKEDVHDPMVNDHHDIARVLCSEMFYCLQQLVGRGPARESVMGHAKESHIRVYSPQRFPKDMVQKGLPMVQWTIVEPQVHTKKHRAGTKTGELANGIVEYLEVLPEATHKVSVRALKADLGADVHANTFTAALSALEVRGWCREGRSLSRS